jgi:hypothetical protein
MEVKLLVQGRQRSKGESRKQRSIDLWQISFPLYQRFHTGHTRQLSSNCFLVGAVNKEFLFQGNPTSEIVLAEDIWVTSCARCRGIQVRAFPRTPKVSRSTEISLGNLPFDIMPSCQQP